MALLVVFDGIRLPERVVADGAGINFGYLFRFRDSPVLQRLGTIRRGRLVAESNRPEFDHPLAGIPLVLDVVLAAAGGAYHAQTVLCP